jgi:hypothetical protein
VAASRTRSETVFFELPNRSGAQRLCERLRPRWFGGCYGGDGTALVAVDLRPAEDDLAALLRAVTLWVRDSGAGAIRYHVDGRVDTIAAGA